MNAEQKTLTIIPLDQLKGINLFVIAEQVLIINGAIWLATNSQYQDGQWKFDREQLGLFLRSMGKEIYIYNHFKDYLGNLVSDILDYFNELFVEQESIDVLHEEKLYTQLLIFLDQNVTALEKKNDKLQINEYSSRMYEKYANNLFKDVPEQTRTKFIDKARDTYPVRVSLAESFERDFENKFNEEITAEEERGFIRDFTYYCPHNYKIPDDDILSNGLLKWLDENVEKSNCTIAHARDLMEGVLESWLLLNFEQKFLTVKRIDRILSITIEKLMSW